MSDTVITLPSPAVPTVERTYLLLPVSQWKKIGTGLVVAMAGAGITYIAQLLSSTDFGPIWTPLAVAFASVLANIGRKYLGLGQ